MNDIRRLASAGFINYKQHCYERMFERGIRRADVNCILTSKTAEIIEVQKPTEKSPNERFLIYDKEYGKDIIIILTPILEPCPELRIITVEIVDRNIWKDISVGPPSLIRIGSK